MRRKVFLLAFMALAINVLSGCATGKLVGVVPKYADDNFATVYIARPSGFAGCALRMDILVNYSEFYKLACGQQIAFRVSADKPITISQTTSMVPDHILISPEKGKSYYFENDCNGHACWLHEANESRFRYIASKCSEPLAHIGF